MRLSCAPAYFGVLLLATAGCGQSGGGGSSSTSITFVNESPAGGPTLTSIRVNDDDAVGLPALPAGVFQVGFVGIQLDGTPCPAFTTVTVSR